MPDYIRAVRVYLYPARTGGYGPGRVLILQVRAGYGYDATGISAKNNF